MQAAASSVIETASKTRQSSEFVQTSQTPAGFLPSGKPRNGKPKFIPGFKFALPSPSLQRGESKIVYEPLSSVKARF